MSWFRHAGRRRGFAQSAAVAQRLHTHAMSKLDLSSLTVGGITPSYVSVAIAGQLMGVSHWTVRRWITAGALPARKLPSGGLRVAVADLEEVGEPVRPDRSGTHRRRPAHW
jgi:hypothetical protein